MSVSVRMVKLFVFFLSFVFCTYGYWFLKLAVLVEAHWEFLLNMVYAHYNQLVQSQLIINWI